MRVRASSASAVVFSLLVNDVLAAVHGRHEAFHHKKKVTTIDVTVTDEIIETKTDIIYVTVEWPSGETIGAKSPAAIPTTVASTTSVSVPAFSAPPASSSVTDTFTPPATSSVAATSVAPVVASPEPATPVAPTTVASVASAAEFIQKPKTISTPPAVVPTTMATVVKPAPNTPVVVVPAPASSTPVSSGSSSTTNTDSSKKRGLAFNNASLTKLFTGGSSEVSWCYNWGQTGSGSAAGLEYIPTLWNNDPSRTGSWAAAASAGIAAGAGHLFSFNEPDLAAQANMDVGTAASAYKQFMQPFAGQAKLGAPAVTNGGGAMGLQYMANFISACSGCTIDFVNIHWYDSATNFAYFKNHVTDAHTKSGGKPVWITEFAASGSAAEQQAFLEVVIPWLDAQPFVERYAYFMAADGVLVSGDSLSNLGGTFTSFVSKTISALIANV